MGELHIMDQGEGDVWVCAEYDHGPMCRRCLPVNNVTMKALVAAAALRQPREGAESERFNGGIGGAEDFFADLEFCHEFIRAQQRSHDELFAEFRTTEAALAKSRGRNYEMKDAYSEYVTLLEDELGNATAFMANHGFAASHVKIERGKQLRRRIAEITGIPGHDVAEAPHESTR